MLAVVMALVAWVAWFGAGRAGAASMLVSAAVCEAFCLYVLARALRCRLEWDAEGGSYHGLTKTVRWTWDRVRSVGRQSVYAIGSTGSSPEVALLGGRRRIVLVGLSDPARPEAEDDLIARLRDALDAHRAAHPSAAQQLADLLRRDARPDAGEAPPAT